MNASEYNITDLIKVIALKLDIDYNLLVNNLNSFRIFF